MGRPGPAAEEVVVDSEITLRVEGSRIITFFLKQGPPNRFAQILYSRNGASAARFKLNVVETRESSGKRFFNFVIVGNGCGTKEDPVINMARRTRAFQNLPLRVGRINKACLLASEALEAIALEIISSR